MINPLIYAKVKIAQMRALGTTRKGWPMAKEKLLSVVKARYDIYGPCDGQMIMRWTIEKMGVTDKRGKRLIAAAPRNDEEWQLLEKTCPKRAAKIRNVAEKIRRLNEIRSVFENSPSAIGTGGRQVGHGFDVSFASAAKNVPKKELFRAIISGRTAVRVLAMSPFLKNLGVNILALKNPIAVTVGQILGRRTVARFKDGSETCMLPGGEDRFFLERYLHIRHVPISINNNIAQVQFDGQTLFFRMTNSVVSLRETFLLGSYKGVCVQGKDVLDIGANIGDTAIYFALKGAKRVIALEPYPATYSIAMENLAINGMNGHISLLNAALGEKKGTILIDPCFMNSSCSPLREFISGNRIMVKTIDDLVKGYKLRNAILKIDCEGGEYAILKSKKLRAFDEIIMEYHYGYKNIYEKLSREGFKVNLVGGARYSFNAKADCPHMIVGMLHAAKKQAKPQA